METTCVFSRHLIGDTLWHISTAGIATATPLDHCQIKSGHLDTSTESEAKVDANHHQRGDWEGH